MTTINLKHQLPARLSGYSYTGTRLTCWTLRVETPAGVSLMQDSSVSPKPMTLRSIAQGAEASKLWLSDSELAECVREARMHAMRGATMGGGNFRRRRA